MKLSIIIPVYNVERTLRACVESAVVRSFDDWEMVLVDDGSKDGSAALCDQLASTDSHIRVVHQPNAGLSEARNTGIQASTGDLLAFVDSDDELRPGTLERMVDIMAAHPAYDILEFPVVVFRGAPYERRLDLPCREYSRPADYWIDGEAYRHAYAWNKVYRRRLFDKLRYPRGRVFEDVHLLPSLLRLARTVATTDEGLYYYNYNPQGITNTADGRALGDLLDAHLRVLQEHTFLLEGKDIESYYAQVLDIQLDVYELTGQPPVLPSMAFNGTLKLRLLKLLGMKRLCQCNKLLHKVVKPSR